jgi:hypothetical protein
MIVAPVRPRRHGRIDARLKIVDVDAACGGVYPIIG